MPGIAGIISREILEKEKIVLIIEAMKYENFYKSETYTYENTAFGLSTFIPDNKIIFNPKTNIIGLMEGEVFGVQENFLDNLCSNKKFSSPDVWKKITGRFAFAFYDIQAKKLFLITDHYGIKPLYYTITDNKYQASARDVTSLFIFASSINAICKNIAQQDVNLQALAEYAVFNFPLGENTFVKNVFRVPPGEILEIDSEFNISRIKYYELSAIVSQPLLGTKQSLLLAPEVFQTTIDNLSKGDKTIGLTLTAGYDTRTILSALRRACLPDDREVQALTVGDGKNIQVRIASQLANVSKCLWIMQDYEDDFAQELEKLVFKTVRYTDGLCEITHTGWLYIFEKHRDYLDPCFTGLGGSELIRGLQSIDFPINYNIKNLLLNVGQPFGFANDDSYGFFSYELLKDYPPSYSEPPPWRGKEVKNLTPSERATNFTLYEIFRKYYGAILTLQESQARIRTPYMDNSFISFILQTPFSILHTQQFSNNLFERLKGQKLSANIINRNAPNLLFTSTDRGYPPLVNLSPLGLPIILFQQLRNRFSPHYNQSSCDKYLRGYAKEILEEPKTLNRQYYNKNKIIKALANYPSWTSKEWEELAKITTFELWLRELSA